MARTNNVALLKFEHCSNLIVQEIISNDVVPQYDHYPTKFKLAVPYLIGSVIYHKGWLKANLHPIF